MTRLTKEEIDFIREVATACPSAMKSAPIILRALDELEEHRAREGQRDGVLLSEEAVEWIRTALERVTGFQVVNDETEIIRDALALLPPKKGPRSVTECAKELVACLSSNDWIGMSMSNEEWRGIVANLRAAIAREEGK